MTTCVYDRYATIRALQAQVEELTRENYRLRCEVQTYQEQNPEAATQGGYARERARAEQAEARLAAETKVLREILEVYDRRGIIGIGWAKKARAALAAARGEEGK